MQVIELGQPYDGPIALALGYFDGMHLGHRTILNKAVELAAKYQAHALPSPRLPTAPTARIRYTPITKGKSFLLNAAQRYVCR